jgi:hypothetical protein
MEQLFPVVRSRTASAGEAGGELARVAAREIGAGGAVVVHENGVADKDVLPDPVGDVGRGVAGQMHHLELEAAEREALAVPEQPVEVGAFRFQVSGVEDRPEDALHLLDVLADADRRAGLRFDVGRRRQVVGMDMRLQHPADGDTLLLGRLKHAVGESGVGGAGRVVPVGHRVDDGGLLRGRIPDQAADGVGRLVEEGADLRGVHRALHGPEHRGLNRT